MKKGKRLLITGASGNLGKILAQIATEHYAVLGTFDQHETQLPNISFIQTDLTNQAMLQLLIKTSKPDAIIHLAAATRPDYCEEHARRTWKINVEVSGSLANKAAELKIPFIFASTDLVFNGRYALSDEKVKPDPICIYGKQKLEAEQSVMARYPQATICRLPTMMGGTSFLNQMIMKLKEGKEIRVFTDEYRSFVSMEDVAKGMLLALENDWRGIWHLGGRESLSRYDLGKMVCDAFKFDYNLLLPIKQYLGAGEFAAPRPRDVSLNSDYAFSNGYNPRFVKDYISDLK